MVNGWIVRLAAYLALAAQVGLAMAPNDSASQEQVGRNRRMASAGLRCSCLLERRRLLQQLMTTRDLQLVRDLAAQEFHCLTQRAVVRVVAAQAEGGDRQSADDLADLAASAEEFLEENCRGPKDS